MSIPNQLNQQNESPSQVPVLFIEDRKGQRTISLTKSIYSIGRGSENSIVLHSSLVSRNHAILLKVTNSEHNSSLFHIIDGDLQGNQSTNGLIINGKRCLSHSLQHGDLVIFGGNDVKAQYLIVNPELLEQQDYLHSVRTFNEQSVDVSPWETLVPSTPRVEPLSESALLRLASFPELLPIPIFEIDLQGKITYLNPASIENFPELQNDKLNHPILAGLLNIIQTEKKESFVREVQIDKRVFEQAVYYIAESRLIRTYLTDITVRKQAEAETRKTLEKEKELNMLKSRFLSMASHELRTPLAIILTSSELLKSFSNKLTEEQKLQQLNKIQIEVKRMTDLLNDVLLIGKSEAGRIEFNPQTVLLSKFCQEILEEIKLIDRENHALEFLCPQENILAEVDANLLRHILTNLLNNAIKYSPEGKNIHLQLLNENEQVIIKVKDEGIGIPEVEQDHLFELFYRASNVGQIPGTGLGMAITKNAVELHGGTLSFSSQVGVGTTFIVCLPQTQARNQIRCVSSVAHKLFGYENSEGKYQELEAVASPDI